MLLPRSAGPLAAIWILGAGVTGLLANVTSVVAATGLLGVGLVPPLLLLMRWDRAARVFSGVVRSRRYRQAR
jgi:hypothetical protein